jgi:hypothetical protein
VAVYLEGLGKIITGFVAGLVILILALCFLPGWIVLLVLLTATLVIAVRAALKGGGKAAKGTLGMVSTVAFLVALSAAPFVGWSAPLRGGWTAIPIILAVFLLIATIIRLSDLPQTAPGRYLQGIFWGRLSDPMDPMSGPRYAPVRVAQWGLTALFIVFLGIFWIGHGSEEAPQTVAAAPSSSAPAQAGPTSTPPSSTAPVVVPASPSSTTTSAPPASGSATATTGECDAPALVAIAESDQKPESVNNRVERCDGTNWVPWSTTQQVIRKADLRRDGQKYNYYRIATPDGNVHLIRTPH